MRAISFKIMMLGLLCGSAFAHPRPLASSKSHKTVALASDGKRAGSARKTHEKSPETHLTRAKVHLRAQKHDVPRSPAPRARAEHPSEAAEAPRPVEQAEPKIHHNRKQHAPADIGAAVSGEASASAGEATGAAEPRKASADDFRTSTRPEVKAAGAMQAANVQAGKGAGRVPTMVPVRPVALTAMLKKVPKPVAPAALEQEAVLVPNGPALYTRRGRLIVPRAMKGTHEILVHQNTMADAEGLDRIQDDDDLSRMRASRLLVPLPVGQGLQADERLPENRRFARPWTAEFLAGLARAHYERFHTAIQVNSAVRTVDFQRKLMRTNGNAAPFEGETASPHLTGQAVDLAKKGLSMAEIAWMRGYLGPLMRDGKVDVEEEFQQACFHISVYKKYLPAIAPKKTVVASHRAGAGVVGMR